MSRSAVPNLDKTSYARNPGNLSPWDRRSLQWEQEKKQLIKDINTPCTRLEKTPANQKRVYDNSRKYVFPNFLLQTIISNSALDNISTFHRIYPQTLQYNHEHIFAYSKECSSSSNTTSIDNPTFDEHAADRDGPTPPTME